MSKSFILLTISKTILNVTHKNRISKEEFLEWIDWFLWRFFLLLLLFLLLIINLTVKMETSHHTFCIVRFHCFCGIEIWNAKTKQHLFRWFLAISTKKNADERRKPKIIFIQKDKSVGRIFSRRNGQWICVPPIEQLFLISIAIWRFSHIHAMFEIFWQKRIVFCFFGCPIKQQEKLMSGRLWIYVNSFLELHICPFYVSPLDQW